MGIYCAKLYEKDFLNYVHIQYYEIRFNRSSSKSILFHSFKYPFTFHPFQATNMQINEIYLCYLTISSSLKIMKNV